MRKRWISMTLALLFTAALPGWSQTEYPTPEAAAKAFRKAGANEAELFKIFGPELEKLLDKDPAGRKESFRLIGKLFQEDWRLSNLEANRKVLRLGAEGWPFPVTVAKGDKGWHFDTPAGIEETLNRRVGRNELINLQTCVCLMLAEEAYRKEARDDSGVRRYTSLIRSSPGKHDGLYWEVKPKQELSPLEAALKESARYAIDRVKDAPWWGYRYRFLSGQGKSAPGGAYNYAINGQQLAGWALVAYPSNYGSTGVMTFICSQDGQIFQRDLGADTIQQAEAMTLFDPSPGWELVDPQDLAR